MNLRNPKLAILVAALFLLGAAGAGIAYWSSRDDHAHESAEGETIYYCPMHPTVVSDRPGNCPICGMKLIKRANPTSAATDVANAGALGDVEMVSISPTQQVMANVAVAPATLTPWNAGFVTTGAITYDETRRAQVTSYTAGRIERLAVEFTGDTVRRGQTVAQIYSPELYSTQQEYLLALANRERMRSAGFTDARSAADDLVDSTRRRLLLFGMTEGQIRELASGGKPFFTTSIVSPVAGVVVQKLVVPQQYVQAGQPLFEIADLSTVWVEADVYEKDLGRVDVGQPVTVTSAAWPDRSITGKVSFVEPLVTAETRSSRVRIEIPNADLRLRPGMFVSVQFSSTGDRGSVVTVPKTAVVDRGMERYVWVQTGAGRYSPRQVTTGGESGDRIAILTGLREGEQVVVQGGFLLDSESQLRQMTAGGGATHDSNNH